jgi:replicative DNA helicase
MSNLKQQQKQLLRTEITGKTMEYLMGLGKKNETAIRRTAEKFTKKIVNAYYNAIKQQHKKSLKVKKSKHKVMAVTESFANQQNLKAS